MPKRQETREHRQDLREALLQECRNGTLRLGDALPPVRELAQRHGLSTTTTQRVLRGMADEGILQLRQGAGAFIGHLPEQSESAFAIVMSDELIIGSYLRAAREGFEAEIARRAAATITLTPQTRGLQPLLDNIVREINIAGTFFIPSLETSVQLAGEKIVGQLGNMPRVTVNEDGAYGEANAEGFVSDIIRFDDYEGAAQAARHLWRRGHRRLAFLGLHASDTPRSEFGWSRRREAGFRDALRDLKADEHVFHPAKGPASSEYFDQEVAGTDAARALIPLLRDGRVKAVVCVNEFALKGLLHAAKEADLPESRWPAMIAFDDQARNDHLLSVVRLAWDDMGRYAAAALWDRAFGTVAQREAPPREILVPTRLVARLSCFENFDTTVVTETAHL